MEPSDVLEQYDVIVVGAGIWGLCAAHTFLTADPSISLLVIDSKSSIGGVWATEQLYPGLRANNLQGYYEYSDFPMLESGLDIEPLGVITGEALQAYLYKYAAHFGLLPHIRLQTEVIRAVEHTSEHSAPTTTGASGRDWILSLRNMSTAEESRVSCAKLVIATGQVNTPTQITFKGLEAFTKPVFHSVHLAKFTPSLINDSAKDITVVGGSKSAHDAVYLFATAGKHVTWVIHRPGFGRGAVPMSTPFVSLGPWKIWLEGILLVRPLALFGMAPWSDGDGFGWIRNFLHRTRLGGYLVRQFFSVLGNWVAGASGILEGPETLPLAPDATMLWYGTQNNVLNYREDFYQLIRDGKVKIVRAEIDHLEAQSIHFDDRTVHQTDAIITATGYDFSATVPLEPVAQRLSWGCPVHPSQDTTYPNIDARADRELFQRFPILYTSPAYVTPDLPERRPVSKTPWRLWRFIAPPSQVPKGRKRNLVFLNAITAYQTPIKAELTSLWAYAFLFDRLAVDTPNEDEVRYEISLWTRFGKWRAPLGMQGKLADFFLDAMPYYDLLLRDLGLRSWRKGYGWFGEIFGGRYEPRHYKGIITEWLCTQKKKLA